MSAFSLPRHDIATSAPMQSWRRANCSLIELTGAGRADVRCDRAPLKLNIVAERVKWVKGMNNASQSQYMGASEYLCGLNGSIW